MKTTNREDMQPCAFPQYYPLQGVSIDQQRQFIHTQPILEYHRYDSFNPCMMDERLHRVKRQYEQNLARTQSGYLNEIYRRDAEIGRLLVLINDLRKRIQLLEEAVAKNQRQIKTMGKFIEDTLRANSPSKKKKQNVSRSAVPQSSAPAITSAAGKSRRVWFNFGENRK